MDDLGDRLDELDDGGVVLTGHELRWVAVATLYEAFGPLELPQLAAHIERRGVEFSGRSSKQLSDALRWEDPAACP